MNLLITHGTAVRLKTPGPEFLHPVSHQRPGPDLIVVADQNNPRRLLVEIHAAVESDAIASAAAATGEMLAALSAEVDAQVEASPECAAVLAAHAAHQKADAELQAARGKLEQVRAEYNRSVANGLNPKAFREPLNAAMDEVTDLEAWVKSLRVKLDAAAAVAAKIDNHAWNAASRGRLETTAAVREDLRRKVAKTMGKLAGELLAIEAMEKALRGPRPSRQVATSKPADAVPIEEQILAGELAAA